MEKRIDSAEKNTPTGLERLKGTVGLAVKAGKTVFGTEMICESLAARGAKKPLLVLEGADTSENTHKKLSDKCKFYEVELIRLPYGMDELSASVGKSSAIAAIAVRDEGLARAIKAKLAEL